MASFMVSFMFSFVVSFVVSFMLNFMGNLGLKSEASESLQSNSTGAISAEYLCQADMGERLVGSWSVRVSGTNKFNITEILDKRVLSEQAKPSDFGNFESEMSFLELKPLRKRDTQTSSTGEILSVDSRYLLHRFPKITMSLPRREDLGCEVSSKECRVTFRFQTENKPQKNLVLAAPSRDPRGGELKWEIYGRLIFESPALAHKGPELRLHYTLEKQIPNAENLLVDGMMIRPAEMIYGDLGEVSANESRTFGSFVEPIEAIEGKLSCDPLESKSGSH